MGIVRGQLEEDETLNQDVPTEPEENGHRHHHQGSFRGLEECSTAVQEVPIAPVGNVGDGHHCHPQGEGKTAAKVVPLSGAADGPNCHEGRF